MIEANFDGLVGPTHNYSGLSFGNVASLNFAKDISSPKQAALQGLHKAKVLADRGLIQGILPPQFRPNVSVLRNLGFRGSAEECIQQAFNEDRLLLSIVSSSSYMWTANAATYCPMADSIDGKAHFTPANLRSKPHRAIEPYQTKKTLECVFENRQMFEVHDPIELGDAFSDEGAANHTRFEFNGRGVHFFVYGREALSNESVAPKKFPARQTLEASMAVARVNQTDPNICFYAQQNPDVIDSGVFHNDVISVGHKNVLLYHESAFLNTAKVVSDLYELSGGELIGIKVLNDQVDLQTAVKTYLFNSQLVTMPEGHMALVAPKHCEEEPSVKRFIDSMLADGRHPVDEVIYFDLLQSMKNGGGPACLRLRVQLEKEHVSGINPGCILTQNKYSELVNWVERNYKDQLTLADLNQYETYAGIKRAFVELSQIMNLSNLYDIEAN
ncbi:MAG: N-succinylarginine dihydrolase [Bdellovibrionaceae bacterium]|nr:N-succinylarginine dihydrolase [Pseudobdellovibrionaceae bacterium]|tara:strand:+ start:113777 stop:115105 length:1329 start_codon:yes stop_codon:yes gene_type:complete